MISQNASEGPGFAKPNMLASQYVENVRLVAHGRSRTNIQSTLQESYLDIDRALSDLCMIINGRITQLMIVNNKPELKTITIIASQSIRRNKNSCLQLYSLDEV